MKILMKPLAIAVLSIATALASIPAHAITAPTAWADHPEDGKPARLDNGVLGEWCLLRAERWEGKNTRLYERKNRCKQWIIIGPTSYRTSDRTCEATKMGFSEAHFKNVVIQYRCTSFENEKTWTENAEIGYTRPNVDDTYLYIMRH
jgi:hypothetical protein